MKKLMTLSALFIGAAFFACSGGGSASTATVEPGKPVYARGEVKHMTVKGYADLGDISVDFNDNAQITDITYGSGKKVAMQYDAEGQLVKLTYGTEVFSLPMFGTEYVAPWFHGILIDHSNADISFSYDNDRLIQHSNAKNGWTEKLTYDAEGRIALKKISDKRGTSFYDTKYTYAEEDGKLYVTLMANESLRYVYDQYGRLVESDVDITDVKYNDYNDIAECKELAWDDDYYGVVVARIVKYTYEYDAEGNWTQRTGKSQKWDADADAPTGQEQDVPVITRTIEYRR